MSFLNRHRFLSATAAKATGTLITPSPAAQEPKHDWFQHGVASGDPLPDAVVLWTRVTPTPDATPGSGIGPPVDLSWQVALDSRFDHVVADGRVITEPRRDHTAKVDATGLRPDTTYYYRFLAGRQCSRIGRTRTAPDHRADLDRLRLGVVSCSSWQHVHSSPYRHLAARTELDAILHLGGYLDDDRRRGTGRHRVDSEAGTLAGYRRRYGRCRTNSDLADLHAAFPWIVAWDDDATAPGTSRRAARLAYDEWMPVRLAGTETGRMDNRVYRQLHFGRLADLSILDLRTHRWQPGSDPATNVDVTHTTTARRQLQRLTGDLAASGAQWKLVTNPMMMAPVRIPPLPPDLNAQLTGPAGLLPNDGLPYNVDKSDGYQADQRQLVRFLADHGITDTVFLTGAVSSAWACDLPRDIDLYPLAPSVATELVCPSLTGSHDQTLAGAREDAEAMPAEAVLRAANRHVHYLDLGRPGFSVLEVSPTHAQMDWYAIEGRADATHLASWAVDAGTQRLRPAFEPRAAAPLTAAG